METAPKLEQRSARLLEELEMEMIHEEATATLQELIREIGDSQFQDLEESYASMIGGRAPRKVNLCARVRELVNGIGTRFSLDDARIARLEVAASIHRLGELALPEHVVDTCFLDLTLEDRATYNSYPMITAQYVRELSDDVHLIAILGMHRQFYLDQKLSASDYDPRHVLDAQILCAATEYEEMMLMKDGVEPDVVRRFMHRSRGLRYHPEVVERLLEIVGH